MSSDFSQFAVENTASVKRAKKVEEAKQRKSISAEAAGKAPSKLASALQDIAPNKPVADEVPHRKKPVTTEQVERHLGKRKNAENVTIDADEEKRRLAIKKYRGYFNGKHTRVFCGEVAPNDNWPLPVAVANLQRARDNAESVSQLDLTALAVEKALKGVEFVVHTMGVNPMEWQLRDNNGITVSDVFRKHKDSDEFQPALDEVGAEIGLTFKANCFMRLGASLYSLCEGFSNEAKRRAMEPSS